MRKFNTEAQFRDECSSQISGHGVISRREVSSSSVPGERAYADIATMNAAFECKIEESNDAMLKAIGQCLAYRSSGMAQYVAIVIPSYCVIPFFLWLAARENGIEILNERTIGHFAANPSKPTILHQSLEAAGWFNFYHEVIMEGIDTATEQQKSALRSLLEPIVECFNRL